MPEVITGFVTAVTVCRARQLIGWPRGGHAHNLLATSPLQCRTWLSWSNRSSLVLMIVGGGCHDLGARPVTVFFRITLPLIVPAIVSGCAGIHNFVDDVVVTMVRARPRQLCPWDLFEGSSGSESDVERARDPHGADRRVRHCDQQCMMHAMTKATRTHRNSQPCQS